MQAGGHRKVTILQNSPPDYHTITTSKELFSFKGGNIAVYMAAER